MVVIVFRVAGLAYPKTPAGDVVDDHHGTKVPDPYRWLEAQGDPAVEAWVDAQNLLAHEVLSGLPGRAELEARLAALWAHERRGLPAWAGGRCFETRNDGGEEQDSLWLVEGSTERRVFAPSGTQAVSVFEPSPDGRLLVLGLGEAGSDWTVLRVLDVASGALLDDTVEWVKFPYVSWLPDGSGFVYAGCSAPPSAEVLTARITGQQVRLHRVSGGEDEVLYEVPSKYSFVIAHVEGDLLVVEAMQAAVPTEILVGPLGGPLRTLVEGETPVRLVGRVGDDLLLQSYKGARNGHVIAAPLDGAPARVVVPEQPEPLNAAIGAAYLFGGHVVTVRTKVMSSIVSVASLAHGRSYDVELPGEGNVAFVRGARDATTFAFQFSSFTTPATVLQHDVVTGETTTRFAPELPGYRPSDYVVEVADVESGGQLVPVQLVRRRDVAPDGTRPTLVTGYGGFGIVFAFLGFQAWLVPWLESGGVLLVGGLRGGGERGETWHEDGMRERKQHVFDDCAAVAEWAVAQGWTSPEHLALTGSSNGGLLAGAVLVQRPDLFSAVNPDVGVLDMLRYQLFTGAQAWVSEYGCADDPEQFDHLHAYSPVHNVVQGRDYPAVLITTGDHDDRVPPGVHSYKLAATLQAAQGADRPVLLRVQRGAGHGQGKASSVQVAEKADLLAFLLAHTR